MEKKSDKIFVYDGNQYAAYKELISGKVSFVLYAKMESDGYELKLIKTDICAFVRGVIADRYHELEEHDIDLDIDIPDEKIEGAVDLVEFS